MLDFWQRKNKDLLKLSIINFLYQGGNTIN